MIDPWVAAEIAGMGSNEILLKIPRISDINKIKNLEKGSSVIVVIPDKREITAEQRRKCFALIGEVAEYVDGMRTKDTIEDTKEMLKMQFMLEKMEGIERRIISLSDCSVREASAFIEFLIEFIIRNDIPTRFPLIDECEDVYKYVYACLMNRKCCICGRSGCDLHHVDHVGSGRNRKTINHLGLRCLPLCREHHQSAHNLGEKSFIEKYHLEPVKIDEKIAKKYKLHIEKGA